jgi:hypothetical protein
MARLPGDILRDIHLGLGALSPADKAEVAEVLVDDLSGMGRVNDTDLAHITPAEAMMLREAGGAGTFNPETGMLEYYTSGVGGPGSTGATGGPGAVGATGPGPGSGIGVSSGGPFGFTVGPTSPSSTSSASTIPSEFGWTPAEAQAMVSALTAESGEAGTSPAFHHADTSTESQIAFDNAQLAEEAEQADMNILVDKLLNPDALNINQQLIETNNQKKQQIQEQQFDVESLLKQRLERDLNPWTQQMRQQWESDLAQLQQPDAVINPQTLLSPQQRNIKDNPFLPNELKPKHRVLLTDTEGNAVETETGSPIDVPNLSIQKMIHDYVYNTAKKNPTMYGLEKYFQPLETMAEQVGFEGGSWLARNEKILQDNVLSETAQGFSNWLGNQLGDAGNFVESVVGDMPLMSFLSRSPLGVIKSFVADMMSKQTKAHQDATKMYLAAQSYAQRGLKIPEVSELAAHDFSMQPYLGEPTFTDQWKTVPTLEQVEGIREAETLERERKEREYQAFLEAEYLKEYRKYFEEVPDDYYGSLRDYETYNPIGIEQLLGNT